LNSDTGAPINDHVAGRRITEKREKFSREAIVHLDHLYRVARHLVEEPDEAHDLVQETYARALSSYDRFTPGSNMKAWLSKILCNLFFDRHREKKRWVSVDDSSKEEECKPGYWDKIPAENPGPEGHLLANELLIKISDALKKIPEEFRLPIIMVDMGECSYKEAAEILSCPIGTIRSRLSRGRALMYEELKLYVEAKK
jgi:RNA polymerase sigma-70 factor (ECF subfamily)